MAAGPAAGFVPGFAPESADFGNADALAAPPGAAAGALTGADAPCACAAASRSTTPPSCSATVVLFEPPSMAKSCDKGRLCGVRGSKIT